MMFWQLTIDANDPALLARFWAQALGYQPAPPTTPATTWHALYQARLGENAAFDDRLAPADDAFVGFDLEEARRDGRPAALARKAIRGE